MQIGFLGESNCVWGAKVPASMQSCLELLKAIGKYLEICSKCTFDERKEEYVEDEVLGDVGDIGAYKAELSELWVCTEFGMRGPTKRAAYKSDISLKYMA